MALIVEDGSIVANANSYNSLANADAYFALVNNTTWANYDPTDQKTPFLVAATRYMQQAFRRRWAGYRFSNSQILDWPRFNVPKFDVGAGYGYSPNYYSTTEIPVEVKSAQCELALRAGNGDLYPDLSPDDMAKSVKIGPLQIVYDEKAPSLTVFTAVEHLLIPLFGSISGQPKIARS